MTTTHSALAVTTDQPFWNATQLAALQQIGVQNASQGDLSVFLNFAQRTGLDPFARQIYMIGRNAKTQNGWTTKWTIQASIDGLRIVAERSGDYAGQVGPEYCGPDGVWRDVWTSAEPPVAARVGVLRHGFSAPLYAVAYFEEYVQLSKEGKPTSMWASKPLLMIAKCAEALALRKAFPNDLAGLYTADEMGAAEHHQPAPAAPTVEPVVEPVTEPVIDAEIVEDPEATPAQIKAIAAMLGKCGIRDTDERHNVILVIIGRLIETAHELTKAEAHQIIETIKPLAESDDPVSTFNAWTAAKMEAAGMKGPDA